MIFTSTSTVTYEECPKCQEPDIKTEHVFDEYGNPAHIEHCPNCGTSFVLVYYDCPNCPQEEL